MIQIRKMRKLMREDIQINERALTVSEQLVEVLESIYDPEIELDIVIKF